MQLVVKIVKWILVGVFIGSLPVLLKALLITVDEKPLTKELLLGDGELFLVAAGLAAAGIGELVFEIKLPGVDPPPPPIQLTRIFAGCLAAIVAGGGAFIYGTHWDDSKVTMTYMDTSVYAMIMAAFCGLCCVILAEVG